MASKMAVIILKMTSKNITRHDIKPIVFMVLVLIILNDQGPSAHKEHPLNRAFNLTSPGFIETNWNKN